ncbi:hypothetical protein CIK05_00475 [Bdellovibrio sp. qaytius]|nr:hypothetical protein CIK05_00475 [Bdellovibrio sp. qaytius]
MKKLLLVFATLGLMVHYSGCTANKAQDDAEFVENADVDKIEAQEPSLDDGSSQALNGTTPSENLSTDNSLEAALGEQTPAAATTASNDNLSLDAAPQDPPPADIAAAPTLDESALNAPPSDVPAEVPADSLAASNLPADNLNLDDPNALAPADDSLSAMNDKPVETPQDPPATAMVPPAASTEAPMEANAAPVLADAKPTGAGSTSLKKVSEATPYALGDGFVNTIYIARPKETLKQISQTIYGSDKTKELKKINSFLKARAPRAGDKIAYVSPNRPTDSSKTITYFEDTGMVPETYVAAKGDNLRKVSKKLLGYDNAWKEVWSTNAIESKTKLAEGETFKYWKSVASITPPAAVAMNEMPKTPEQAVNNIVKNNTPPPAEVAPPPQPAMNDLPPPPPQADLPPAPTDALAANTAPPAPADPALDAAMPPPPPQDAFAAAPPPPPPADVTAAKPKKAPAAEGEEVAAEGGDDMMTMLGIGVVLFGALAFVLVKRKKAQANRSHDAQAGEGLGT